VIAHRQFRGSRPCVATAVRPVVAEDASAQRTVGAGASVLLGFQASSVTIVAPLLTWSARPIRS
jgi:hypothetical protein